MTDTATFSLSAETLEKIDTLIPRYPEKQACLLPVLTLIMDECGFISREAQEWAAEKLELKPINVHEVVTFYDMYREQPTGKAYVKICRTLSCALVGAYKTCDALEQKLNCPRGTTTEDGKYTVEFVECLGDCGFAPVVQVNDKLYENVTADKVDELAGKIERIAAGEAVDTEQSSFTDPAYKG